MVRVITIGGGYEGVMVVKGLDLIADVVLIERKDQFAHHAAALRATVDTVWEHAIFMPYTNLLHRGKVLHGIVSCVDGTTVHIFDHDPIEVDYVVFAARLIYPLLVKYSSYRSSVVKVRLEQLHENLGQVRLVMIVGGGTAGIELIGELASASPGLGITIVEALDQILGTPGYTDTLYNEINERLSALGVRIVTGSKLAYLPPRNVGDFSHSMVETRNGETIEADLWFQCHDARVSTSFLIGSDYEFVMNPNGTIRVDSTMEVADHPNIYAVGDLTDVRGLKRTDAVRQQARVVTANTTAQIEGEKPDAIYQPTKERAILPLGPNMGTSQLLDADGQTHILGAEQIVEIKGTDPMMFATRSQLNLP